MAQRSATTWESGWSPAAPAETEPHPPAADDVARVPPWAAWLPDWFIKWAPPATLGAIVASLLIHLFLLLIAAIVHFGGGQAGGGGDDTGGQGGVALAVMTEAELGQMQNAGLDADAPAVPELSQTALPTSAETDLSVQDAAGGAGDQGGLAQGLGGITSGMGAGNISGGAGLGSGGGAGGGAASFFGLEARGTRFAYICDVSGSMDSTVGSTTIKRIDLLKQELSHSLDALLENAHFFVCLFSGEAKPLGDRREWISANESGKQWERRSIPAIVANGETDPVPAFKIIFALRPKPDAIYFMTDGEFTEDAVSAIARMNAEWRIPIHCITLVSREGERVMKKIAADSGGTYAHVPGPGGG